MAAVKKSALVWAATVFDENDSIDEPAFRRQLKRLREAEVAVYLAGPGLGAAYQLSRTERNRIFAIARDEFTESTSLRAGGCEPRSIPEMVDFLQSAEEHKLDGANLYALDMGHGAKPTTDELNVYYRSVIESTSLPLFLSFHHTAGYLPPLDFIEDLVARYPHIAGVSYGGSDLRFLASLAQRFASRIEVRCAGLFNGITTLALGGAGFMGAEGNIAPQLCTATIKAYEAGDFAAVKTHFAQLMALHEIIMRYNGNPSSQRAIKPLMNALGLPGGHVRSPTRAIDAAAVERMTTEVVALGIPELADAGRIEP